MLLQMINYVLGVTKMVLCPLNHSSNYSGRVELGKDLIYEWLHFFPFFGTLILNLLLVTEFHKIFFHILLF